MKIVIATGGTAGHIFPALHVAEAFQKAGHEVCFAGVFGPARQRIQARGYSLKELDARGLSTQSLGALFSASVLMIKAVRESVRFLKEIRPAAVIGFGGYGAFPVVLAAVFARIPTMIHEQNVYAGRANKLLAHWVNRIAVSFEKSQKFFPSEKTVITGCPCRFIPLPDTQERVLEEFSLEKNRFTIFVFGGSQGSHRINSVFLEMIPLLQGFLDLQVIHACGEKDFPVLRERCCRAGIPYYLTPFLERMDMAYAAANLVISRSGAMTVTEIAGFGVPAVLIPYPFAGGHQKGNAEVLVETGNARMIEEKDLTPESLQEAVLAFAKPSSGRKGVLPAAHIYRPDAANRIAEEVLRLAR